MKPFNRLFRVVLYLLSLSPIPLSSQWLEATIYVPDSLCGVAGPQAGAFSPTFYIELRDLISDIGRYIIAPACASWNDPALVAARIEKQPLTRAWLRSIFCQVR